MDPRKKPTDYEVMIVGAGSVGLTLANLLGQHGIRTLVMEKEFITPDPPRAPALRTTAIRTAEKPCQFIYAV